MNILIKDIMKTMLEIMVILATVAGIVGMIVKYEIGFSVIAILLCWVVVFFSGVNCVVYWGDCVASLRHYEERPSIGNRLTYRRYYDDAMMLTGFSIIMVIVVTSFTYVTLFN